MNEQQYREQVLRLAAVFDATPTTKAKSDEMTRSLSVIPSDHIAALVNVIIDTRQSGFMPTPGEIKAEYTNLVLGIPMPDERLQWVLDTHREQERQFDAAYFAKPVTQRGARGDYHPKAPTEFPDAVTAEAVRLCGWAELIHMDREYRAQFWSKKYALARELVAKRVQAGEVRLSLPQPDELRPALKAVAS